MATTDFATYFYIFLICLQQTALLVGFSDATKGKKKKSK